jgi:integrase
MQFLLQPPGKGRSLIEPSSTAVRVLREHRAQLNANPSGLVFPTARDVSVKATNFAYRSFKPILERAGLLRIRLHDLRHTCATILLMAGKHPKYVQELLGHASISITLDTYSHVIEGMDGGLAETMDDAL